MSRWRPRPLRTLTSVRSARRASWPWDKGEGPVELVIIALPMVLVTFIVLQAALVYYARSTALAAATQGANAARLYGSSTAIGKTEAQQFLDEVGGPLQNTSVTVRPGVNEVTVTVTGRAVSIIPWVHFNVSQSAHGPIERFVT